MADFNKREKGAEWEDMAIGHLKEGGFKVVERNFRCKIGEVDVIAAKDKSLYFIEVKGRTSGVFGTPWDAVGPEKQRKIRRVAEYYILKKRVKNTGIRFGVVGLDLGKTPPSVRFIEDSFDNF